MITLVSSSILSGVFAPTASSDEFFWLSVMLLISIFMWLPYILQEILSVGAFKAMAHKAPWTIKLAPWAERARAAHRNNVENLVVFAPLALMIAATGQGDDLTAGAAMIYVLARLAHYPLYVMAIPGGRTLAFLLGMICQLVMALRLLGAV